MRRQDGRGCVRYTSGVLVLAEGTYLIYKTPLPGSVRRAPDDSGTTRAQLWRTLLGRRRPDLG